MNLITLIDSISNVAERADRFDANDHCVHSLNFYLVGNVNIYSLVPCGMFSYPAHYTMTVMA